MWLTSTNICCFQRHLARVTDLDATDTSNPNLNYGLVVDCGSSGSRVFVYCWPRHNGNPRELLDIQQMRDQHRKPVVMKIKPGKMLSFIQKNEGEGVNLSPVYWNSYYIILLHLYTHCKLIVFCYCCFFSCRDL